MINSNYHREGIELLSASSMWLESVLLLLRLRSDCFVKVSISYLCYQIENYVNSSFWYFLLDCWYESHQSIPCLVRNGKSSANSASWWKHLLSLGQIFHMLCFAFGLLSSWCHLPKVKHAFLSFDFWYFLASYQDFRRYCYLEHFPWYDYLVVYGLKSFIASQGSTWFTIFKQQALAPRLLGTGLCFSVVVDYQKIHVPQ